MQADRSEFRQQAAQHVVPRPRRAIGSATDAIGDDPDLPAVIVAWPNLPEAVRASARSAWPRRPVKETDSHEGRYFVS